jgi:hypothetical protein
MRDAGRAICLLLPVLATMILGSMVLSDTLTVSHFVACATVLVVLGCAGGYVAAVEAPRERHEVCTPQVCIHRPQGAHRKVQEA